MEIWKPKVGDKVYLVPNDTRWNQPRYVTITKVGRKYVEYGDSWWKIDLSTMAIVTRDYGCQGYVFKSEDSYHNHLKVQDKFRYVKEKINCLTDEQVEIVYGWLTVNKIKE